MNDTQEYLTHAEEEEQAAVLAGEWDGPSEEDLQDYLTGNLLTERPN